MLRDAERAFLRDLQAASRSPGSLLIMPGSRTITTSNWKGIYVNSVMPASRLTIDCPLTHPSGCAPWLREPALVHEIDWDGNGGRILGPDAYLRFDLDKPEFVSRLAVSFLAGRSRRHAARHESSMVQRHQRRLQQYNCRYESATGEEAEIIVYIDDTISKVLIFPNNRPSTFRMSKIELLLPAWSE